MKVYITLCLLMSLYFTGASQAQVEKVGLFGFKRGDKNELSSELFPNNSSEGEAPLPPAEKAVEPSNKIPAGFKIFKSGKPKKVGEVSYVIEDGEKVETAIEGEAIKKDRGLFSFGKKKKSKVTGENIELAPEAPTPVAYQTPAVSEITDPMSLPEELLEATNKKARDKKSGFFGLFGGKKRAEVSAAPSTIPVGRVTVSQPEASAKPSTATVPQPATASSSREVTPIPTANSPKPSLAPVVVDTETIKVEGETIAKEEKRGPKFLITPINKLKAAKNKSPSVDLTDAETIIQDGEIVTSSSTNVVNGAIEDLEANMPGQAPQVINGATTYSSWDDVKGTTSSAVDKILRQMR
jgi:hypothetical protein